MQVQLLGDVIVAAKVEGDHILLTSTSWQEMEEMQAEAQDGDTNDDADASGRMLRTWYARSVSTLSNGARFVANGGQVTVETGTLRQALQHVVRQQAGTQKAQVSAAKL